MEQFISAVSILTPILMAFLMYIIKDLRDTIRDDKRAQEVVNRDNTREQIQIHTKIENQGHKLRNEIDAKEDKTEEKLEKLRDLIREGEKPK